MVDGSQALFIGWCPATGCQAFAIANREHGPGAGTFYLWTCDDGHSGPLFAHTHTSD